MVEDVVEIYAHLEFRSLAESEKLPQSEIYSPRSGPDKRVSFRNFSVVENIGARRRYREGSGIEEPIATYARVRIANKSRTETRTTKIADRIDKAAGDVARENRTAVVARPERRKAGTALGKHVPRDLKTTQHSVSRFRERVAIPPSTTDGNVVRAVRNQPVT